MSCRLLAVRCCVAGEVSFGGKGFARHVGYRWHGSHPEPLGVRMVIVNLTPHVLNIFLPSQVERKGRMLRAVKGIEAVMSLPSVGFARSQEVIEELRSLDCGGILLPVVRKRFAVVVDGLPAPKESTVFIVSFLTAQAVRDREDVYFPGEALRDDDGNIIGCVGLARV